MVGVTRFEHATSASRPLDIGRFESDMEILGKIYWLGYHDMQAHFDELKAYLEK